MCFLRRSPFSLSGIGIGGGKIKGRQRAATDEDDACERAVPSILTRLRRCFFSALLGHVVVVAVVGLAVAFCSEGCNADGRSDPSDNHSMRVDQSKQQCASREEAAAEPSERREETENPIRSKSPPIVLLPFDAPERQKTVKRTARSKDAAVAIPSAGSS